MGNMAKIFDVHVPVKRLNPVPFEFLEGPVWDDVRQTLFFSDPLAQTIVAMTTEGVFHTICTNTGYVNGMCLNKANNLVVCKMETGSLEEINPDTGETVGTISFGFGGKPFNATNDVVCNAAGGYYVTDPVFTFGPKTQSCEATYYVTPEGQTVQVATDSLKPNGLALSPCQTKLYIDDTLSTKVWCYTIERHGLLTNPTVFCDILPPKNPADLPPVQRFGEADGLKVDSLGNVYVATFTGIQVFDPAGIWQGCIPMPGDETAANMAFGGADKKTLYVTARTSLYGARLLVSGI